MIMRKIVLYIATSLDSYIARPDGSVDWLVDRPYEKKWIDFIESSDDISLEIKGGLRGWIASPPENSRIKNIHAQYENWKRNNVKKE